MTATLSALGQSQTIGVISDGSTAALSLNGTDYAVPSGRSPSSA